MNYLYLLTAFALCNVFLSVASIAQRKNSKETLIANSIKSSHTYSFSIANEIITQDSTLTVIRKYNKHGRTTHTKLHDSTGVAYMTYEYLYDDDGTTYLGRNVFANPSYRLQYSTEVSYNKKQLLARSVDYRPGSKKKGGASYEYNKLNQLTGIELERNGNVYAHQTYTYDSSGNIKTSVLTVLKKLPFNSRIINDKMINTYVRIADGHQNLSFEEKLDDNGKVKQFKLYARENIEVLGADDMIDLQSGDELTIDIAYFENGLIKN